VLVRRLVREGFLRFAGRPRASDALG
jgi:hypothetical protein